jgi:hypothetical protein
VANTRAKTITLPDGSTAKIPAKSHDHAKKSSTTASRTRSPRQVVPEVKGRIGGKIKTGPKPRHIHRKEITLPPTVDNAARLHADELGMTYVDYYNACVVAYFSRVLTGAVTLTVPAEKCEACGNKTRSVTRPNIPAESGFARVRCPVRFTDNVAKMLFQLAEEWFGGTWSWTFEFAVRDYLGKRNPPPEGKGHIPGVKVAKGRPRKGETAEDRVVRALAASKGLAP